MSVDSLESELSYLLLLSIYLFSSLSEIEHPLKASETISKIAFE
jgi:hypothetical protein